MKEALLRRVQLTELEQNPEEVISLAEAGETVLIVRDGVAILRLEPVPPIVSSWSNRPDLPIA